MSYNSAKDVLISLLLCFYKFVSILTFRPVYQSQIPRSDIKLKNNTVLGYFLCKDTCEILCWNITPYILFQYFDWFGSVGFQFDKIQTLLGHSFALPDLSLICVSTTSQGVLILNKLGSFRRVVSVLNYCGIRPEHTKVVLQHLCDNGLSKFFYLILASAT
jgi:hypothetical protein